MATRNVGGHNVTSVLNGSHHTVAHPSQPSFMPTQGPADYNGGSKSGGNFPGARPSRGKAQPQTAVSPPNAMTTGNK